MIKVNEIFGPTIQGEGKSAGRPVAFLRLANCNLHCIWCDTPHTWNWIGTKFSHPDKYDKEKEVHDMSVEDTYSRLVETGMSALVISGGEPLLQQRQLIPLLQKLKALNWWVEVETNGTVPLRPEFTGLVDQINCSPKLSHSLDSLKLRIRETTLKALATEPKLNFKFVVRNDDDVDEALHLISQYDLDRREIRLMPECRTREELAEKELWLQEACSSRGLIYCTRLSILQSGTKRGV
jgi:7-carboxy-7-deazaguanine synthase